MRSTIHVLAIIGVFVFGPGWSGGDLRAQSGFEYRIVRSHLDAGVELNAPGALPGGSEAIVNPVPGHAGAGLVITPTFDPSIDTPTQSAINSAIAFYQNTITTPITVSIYFTNMNSGLGESLTYFAGVDYPSFRAALAGKAVSADDGTALANTPSTMVNPVDGGTGIVLTTANGRALGFTMPGASFNFTDSPCPTFTGDACILINVALANQIVSLNAVVQHEIDEVLGLGSALYDGGVDEFPHPEDLFRWQSAGMRSYSRNPSTSTPCASGTSRAFFSFDGGVTNINEFNNCDNGGDYGDWITHSPSQVQDAFTNHSGSPSLTAASSEARALDVIGYNLVVTKKRSGQITSQ